MYSTNETQIQTNYKIITISKSCNKDCLVVIRTNWKKTPKIKSWDVIGMRVEGTILREVQYTNVISEGTKTIYNTPIKFENGYGQSVKLPSSKASIISSTIIKKGGRVYASYQHAKQSVTELQSKDYVINVTGMGSVFEFKNGINKKYDNTKGISIEL